jgi:hypothetical protein
MNSLSLKTARARTMLCVLGTILGLLLFSLALLGQTNAGRILGTVTDQTGAVLPGATVSIIRYAARYHASSDHGCGRGV